MTVPADKGPAKDPGHADKVADSPPIKPAAVHADKVSASPPTKEAAAVHANKPTTKAAAGAASSTPVKAAPSVRTTKKSPPSFAMARARFQQVQDQKNQPNAQGQGLPSSKKRKLNSSANFDVSYDFDSLKPMLPEFLPDDQGLVAFSLAAIIGDLHKDDGTDSRFPEEARKPSTTHPFALQAAGGHVTIDEVPLNVRHSLISYGLFPIPHQFPSGQLFGATCQWEVDIDDPQFSLEPKLLSELFFRFTECLLEAGDRAADPDGATDVISTNPYVVEQAQSMLPLGDEAPKQNRLTKMNNQFGCDVVAISSVHFLTNASRHSSNYPATIMKPPEDAFEKKHDQHMKSFHTGRVANQGLDNVIVDTRKFRERCKDKPGLAFYIAYKRAEARNKEGVAIILSTRGSKIAEAKEKRLFQLTRCKYNNSTPAATWNRMYGMYPERVRKKKVYGDYVSWSQAGCEGMLVSHFAIVWPLVLCGHVDGLKKQEDRDKWHNIFVGDAAEKLGNMVQFWGWEEFGYPLDWPNGTKAPPRLRISSHTEADMAKVKKQMFQFQKDAQNNVLQLMKVDGRYTIGSVFFQPDVANQLYLTRTLMSHEEEEDAEVGNSDMSHVEEENAGGGNSEGES